MPPFEMFGMLFDDSPELDTPQEIKEDDPLDFMSYVRKERARREAYQQQRAAEILAANPGLNNEMGALKTGLTTGTAGLIEPIVRVVDPIVRGIGSAVGMDTSGENYADYMASENEAATQAQRQAVQQSDMSTPRKWLNNNLSGVTSSMLQAAAIAGAAPAAIPGTAAMALGFGAIQGEQSFAEAKAAGLPTEESLWYAGKQALAEGGIQGAMGAIPGMAGTEGVINTAIRGGADDVANMVRQPLRKQLGRVGKNLGAESVEELATSAVQTVNTANAIPGQENAASFYDENGNFSLTGSPAGQVIGDTLSHVGLMGAFSEGGLQARGWASRPRPEDTARIKAAQDTQGGNLVTATENASKGPQNERGLQATTKFDFQAEDYQPVSDFVSAPSEQTLDALPTRIRDMVLGMDLTEAAQTLEKAAFEQRMRENDVRASVEQSMQQSGSQPSPPSQPTAPGMESGLVSPNGTTPLPLGAVAEVPPEAQGAILEQPVEPAVLGQAPAIQMPYGQSFTGNQFAGGVPFQNPSQQLVPNGPMASREGVISDVPGLEEGGGTQGGREGLLAPTAPVDVPIQAPKVQAPTLATATAPSGLPGKTVIEDAVERAMAEGLITAEGDATSLAQSVAAGKTAEEALSVLRGQKNPPKKQLAPVEKPSVIPGEASQEIKKPEPKIVDLTGMAGAIGENLRDMLWSKVQSGETSEAGQQSAILQAAKMVRDKGGLKTRDEFIKFADEVQREKNQFAGKPEYQQKIKDVVDRWTPASNADNQQQPKKKLAPVKPAIPPLKIEGGQTIIDGLEDAGLEIQDRERAEKQFKKDFGPTIDAVEDFDGPEMASKVREAFPKMASAIKDMFARASKSIYDNNPSIDAKDILAEIGIEARDFRHSENELYDVTDRKIQEVVSKFTEYRGDKIGDKYFDESKKEYVTLEGFTHEPDGGHVDYLVRGDGKDSVRQVSQYDLTEDDRTSEPAAEKTAGIINDRLKEMANQTDEDISDKVDEFISSGSISKHAGKGWKFVSEGGSDEHYVEASSRKEAEQKLRDRFTEVEKSNREFAKGKVGEKAVESQSPEPAAEKTFDEQMDEFTKSGFGLNDTPAAKPKKKLAPRKKKETSSESAPTTPQEKPKKTPRSKLGTKLGEMSAENKAELKAAFEKLRDFGKGGSTTLYSIGGFDKDKAQATVDVLKLGIKYGVVKFADMVVMATEFIGEAAVRDLGPYFKAGWNTLHKSGQFGVDQAGDVESVLASQEKSTEEVEKVQPDNVEPEPDPEPTIRGTAPQDNHFIAEDDQIAAPGIVGKLKGNLAAIRLLRTLQKEDRNATHEEKKVLAQFVGWGSLQHTFDTVRGDLMRTYPGQKPDTKRRAYLKAGELNDYRNALYDGDEKFMEKIDARIDEWEKHFGPAQQELRTLLTAGEIAAASASTINAHYTSKDVISGMWDAVLRMGIKSGRFLEPAAGVGSFIGLSPWSTNESTAIELDSVSAQLLEKLYPQSKVLSSNLASVNVAPGSYDLTISNVPFADIASAGPEVAEDSMQRYGRKMNLHNYFITRMIDATRPGGITAVITTHFTLDSMSQEDRELMASKADLVGAVRLPNDAFSKNAGTEVTTDILFFRRKTATPYFGAKPFLETVEIGKDKIESKAFGDVLVPIVVNRYFAEHPEMVLGQHSMNGSMYGDKSESVGEKSKVKGEYTVLPKSGQDTTALLSEAVKTLPKNITSSDAASEESTSEVAKAKAVPMGRLVMDGGKVKTYDADGNKVEPDWLTRHVYLTAKNEPRKLLPSKTKEKLESALNRAKDYIDVRDVFEKHMDLMVSSASDEEVAKSREKLNAVYDAFVSKHGFLTTNKLLKGDPSYWRVAALEVPNVATDEEDSNTKTSYHKADVFFKRINTGVTIPTKISSIEDGIRLSGTWRGRLDPAWIAERMGTSEDQVVHDILESGKGFIDPQNGLLLTASEYLRGNVRHRLEQARLAAKADAKFEKNVDALLTVQPQNKTIDQFDFRLGAFWIPENVIQEYARGVLGDRWATVTRNDEQDVWAVKGEDIDDRRDWYMTSHHLPKLLQKILNNMDVQVTVLDKDKKKDEAKSKIESDKNILAKMKIVEQFKAWVMQSKDRQVLIENAYNERVNHTHVGEVDDASTLVLPGSNQDIQLDPHQKTVVWRMLRDRAGMYAHAPGAGKTYAMIATAMEMRRLGMARKPMIVVQNSTLGQFATSFQRFYPNAKVLVATTEDLGGDNRLAFLNRIAVGDYDAVVIAHSTFNLKLANNPKTEEQFFQHQIDVLTEQLAASTKAGEGQFTVKQIQKKITALRKRIKAAQDRAKEHNDKDLFFEDMGVDALFVDEAHGYKKPFYYSTIDEKVRGVERSSSAAAVSAMMKVRHIQDKMGGKNVFFATGTPITNTLGEVFHMINYTNPQLLKDFGVDTFDKFVSQFASIEQIETINAGGRMVRRSVLAKFRNGEELGKLIRLAWDVLTTGKLHLAMADKAARKAAESQAREGDVDASSANSTIPRRVTGAIIPVFVNQSKSFKRFASFLQLVDAEYQELKGIDKRIWSWVNVMAYGAAKYAAIDPRLVDANAEDDPGSKVNVMIDKIMEIDGLHPGKGHVIFSDVANKMDLSKLEGFVGKHGEFTSKDAIAEEDIDEEEEEEDGKSEREGTNSQSKKILKEQGTELFLYRDIVRKLVERGIPKEQIAIINDFATPAKKTKLLDDFNSGKVRFLIGHTQTVGTGVNIQKNLIGMYHLETPWTPSAMDQRSARGIRQGNENEEVYEFIFGMKDSLDGALLDKLDKKRVMYDQALEGKLGVEFDDPMSEEIMSIRDMVGEIQNDPLLKESRKLENDIRELRMQEAAFEASRWSSESAKQRLERQNTIREADIARDEAAIKYVTEFDPNTPTQFNGKLYPADSETAAQEFNDFLFKRLKAIAKSVADGKYSPLTSYVTVSTHGRDTQYHVGNVIRGPVVFQMFAAPVINRMHSDEDIQKRLRDISKADSIDELFTTNAALNLNTVAFMDYAVMIAVNGAEITSSEAQTLSGMKAALTTLGNRMKSSIDAKKQEIQNDNEKIQRYEENLKRTFEGAEALREAEKRLKEVKDAMIARDAAASASIRSNPASVVSIDDRSNDQLVSDDDDTDSGDDILARAVKTASGNNAGVTYKKLAEKRTDGRPDKLNTRDSEPGLSHTAIRKRFIKLFGLPISAADYAMGNTVGIYDPKQYITRLARAHIGDLGTMLHEIAHHVDKVLMGKKGLKLIFNDNNLRNQLAGFDYDPLRKDRSKAVTEGFAEFVRMWATEPDIEGPSPLGQRAPDVWLRWNQWLDKGGELQQKLLTARELVQRKESQSSSDAIGAQMVEDTSEIQAADRTANEIFNDIYNTASYLAHNKLIDDRVGIKMADDEARRLGYKGDITAYELALATDGTADRQAFRATKDGVHRVSEGAILPGMKLIGKGLAQYSKEAGIKDDLDLENAEKYATARFTLEMREKKPKYRGPISPEHAEDFIDGLSAEDIGRYETYANGMRSFAADLVRMLADAGVMTPQEAQAIISSSDYYIPFMRVTDDTMIQKMNSLFGGNHLMTLGKGVRRRSMTGSDSPILRPTLALFLQAQHFYDLANKQQVVLQLRKEAMSVKGFGFLMNLLPKKTRTDKFKVSDVYDQFKDKFDAAGFDPDMLPDIDPDAPGLSDAERKQREILGNAILKVYRRQYRKGENRILSININKDNGEVDTEEWEINGTLADAIDRRPEIRGLVPRIFKGFVNALKFGAIESSPVFGTLNVFRDWQAFQKNTKFSKGFASTIDPFVYLGHYIKARYSNIEDEAAQIYDQWGGNLATRYGISSISAPVVVRKLIAGGADHSNAAVRLTHKLGDKINQAREILALSEVGPRFSEFVHSLQHDGYERRFDESTKSYKLYNLKLSKFEEPPRNVIARAILAAGDVSNNYRVKGELIRRVDDYIPLIGASVAGLYKSYRNYKGAITKDAKEADRQRVVVYTMLSAAYAMLYWALRHDDDDYLEQEDFLRDNYWTFADFEGNPILRIPKGHDTAIVPNMVEGLLNSLTGNSRQGFLNSIVGTAENLVPPAFTMVNGIPIPNLAGVTPLMETTFGYDTFRKQKIEYDGPGAEHPTTRVKPWTGELARAIGSYTGEIGISPIKIEHLIDRLTGGFGLRAVRVGESAVKALTNPSVDTAAEFLYSTGGAIPIPGNPLALHVKKDYSASPNEFYEKKKELSERLVSARKEAKRILEGGGEPPEQLIESIRQMTIQNSVMERSAGLMRGINQGVSNTKDREERFSATKFSSGIARKSLGKKPLDRYPQKPTDDNATESVKAVYEEEVGRALKTALQNHSLNLANARNSDGDRLDEEEINSIEAARQWIRKSGVTMLEATRILNRMRQKQGYSKIPGVEAKQRQDASNKRALLGRILRQTDADSTEN